nr:DDE-type integrase/transposase/recombinase [Croceicoccus hydrothermalis]
MKRHGSPEVITTDGLRSYKVAMCDLGNSAKQETGRRANNRAENLHLPFQRRERAMLRFRQMKLLQKFSVHASFHNHCNSQRHLVDRETYKVHRSVALAEWQNLMDLECREKGALCKTESTLHPTDSSYAP